MPNESAGKSHLPSGVTPLALTMGEPAGIAAEITVKAWEHFRTSRLRFFVIGCESPLRSAFEDLGILGATEAIKPIADPSEAVDIFTEHLPLLPLSKTVDPVLPGGNTPLVENAAAVLQSIDEAVALCCKGKAAGIVTNPIHKAVLIESGFAFTGHTDYLAHLCGLQKSQVVMMLANRHLRTVPITVHQALRDVSANLNEDLIKTTARIVCHALQDNFGIESPRMKVAGLNPHAGEGGSLGDEEQSFINRAIADLQKEGLDIQGTFAADSLFSEALRDSYDVALCMYHDQALIPIKTLDFEHSVNISLGLPIIRTSPDHGSACDIKGKNSASAASLIAALETAWDMANTHSQ